MTWKLKGAALVAAAMLIAPAQAAELGAKDDPIKIPINEWTGQHLSSHILGQLLVKMGYKAEYVTAGGVPQFAAIAQGDLHVQPETWENNVGEIYPKAVASGDIVIVGKEGLSAREGWIYPPYMKEKCPGLPNWKALWDCAQAFGTAETFPKGRLVTYPADWGTREKDLIANVDMPFVPVAGGSEGAMVAELKAAYDAKQPIIMMFWEPHWIHADYKFDWIEWPTDVANCDTDPTKGMLPDKVNDCGFQQAGVLKVVWKGFKDKWPAAYKLIEQFTLTNAQQNPLILEVDGKGRKVEEVAAEWIANNEAIWKAWVEGASS